MPKLPHRPCSDCGQVKCEVFPRRTLSSTPIRSTRGGSILRQSMFLHPEKSVREEVKEGQEVFVMLASKM